ncbi:MAG TPA: hypothetical protein VF077_00075, partial [Nitrospiraceae bacterium]
MRASNEVTDNLSKLARHLFKGWGLIDLPLRASNEGLLRPRVARAQKIIRLHPLPPLLMGNSPRPLTTVTLCSTMQQTKAYHRGLYRLPVTYP